MTRNGVNIVKTPFLVAGISIVVGVVYWILCLVKGLPTTTHKGFGVALAILALICAIFTGLAYSIPTIPSWNTPFNWIGQIGVALLGGGALAVVTLVLGCKGDKCKAPKKLFACGIAGCVLALITLIGQAGAVVSLMSSTGLTLAAVLGEYAWVACIAALLMMTALAVWAYAAFGGKGSQKTLMIAALVIVLIGLVLMRICFYGIYLSVGLAIL